ncbi:MAG: TonB-dependent receptor family protein, partial [Nitrospinales bacterium]
WKLDVLSYFNFFERNWFIANGPDSSKPTTNGQFLREFFVFGVEPRLRWKNWVAGLRLHHEQQDDIRRQGNSAAARGGVTTRDADLSTDAVVGYIETEFKPWKGFAFTTGVRHEALYQDRTIGLLKGAGGTGDEVVTHQTLYGFGAVQKVTNALNIFFDIRKAFQPLTFNQAVNPTTGTKNDLDPGTSVNYEAGARFDLPSRRLHADVTFFRLDFSNQIVSQAGVLTNAGETRHQGIEASLAYSPWQYLTFDGSLTFMVAEAIAGVNKDKDLPMAPGQLYNWGIEYQRPFSKNKTGNLRLEGRFVDDQFTDSANTVAESANGNKGLLPSYTVWNLKAELNAGSWSVFAGVNNLFDNKYRVRRQSFFNGIIPGLTQNFFAGATFKF